VLFEIDKTQFDADLKKARADIAKAEADIKNWVAQIKLAEAEFSRTDEAFKKGVGSKTDFDKAAANVDVAKAQLDVAKASQLSAAAAEAKAAENLRYCTILAPADGRIGLAKVAEKSIVDAYRTELVEVFPTDPIYAVAEVDELTSLWYRDQIYEKKEIPNPRDKDTPLHCWITFKNGRTYPPRDQPGQPVDYIDPVLVRGTGTRTVRATFPNPDGRLSGGDSVRVTVDAGRPRQVLTVPETAVFAQQRKRYVYVASTSSEGDKAELREVEPGPAFDGVVIVEKGLTAADRVIVDNLLRVRPGVPVQVKQ
jgi:RND family efflux transporter MFP subunit